MNRDLFQFAGIAALSLLFALGAATTAEAQQWSATQNEVWSAVSGICTCLLKADVEGLYKYVHKDLIWWNHDNDVPGDYAAAKDLDTAFLNASRKWLALRCTPITIQVFDGFAVVNGYLRGYRAGGAGESPQFETMRLHLVMKKEGSAWLTVSNYLESTQR